MKEKPRSNNLSVKFFVLSAVLMIIVLPLYSGEIDDNNKWAWSTNSGWINCKTDYGSVEVFSDHLEGYAWAENFGWIKLGTYSGGDAHTYANSNYDNYGVNNDGTGNLSGYAWSTNAGWIDFDTTYGSVTIDGLTGEFSGYAWSENVGWISFSGETQARYDYFVLTDWRDPSVPVTLSSFTAAYANGTSILLWTTQSESSNLGWNIYRSMSDIIEESMQINPQLIPGAGTTSEPTEYSFDDPDDLTHNTEYWYWLENMEVSGETHVHGPISLLVPQDGEEPEAPEVPLPYGLHQNYPNPFNPSGDGRSPGTTISFLLPEECTGDLIIYNIRGQKVRTIFTGLKIPAGDIMTVSWNGRSDSDENAGAGLYYYRLSTDDGDYVRKMILVK